jgi:hypothetical protein
MAALIGVAFAASGAESLPARVPVPPPEASADDTALTGKQIYARVLDNRFDSYMQLTKLVSGDRSGKAQETEFVLWYLSFRQPDGEPANGQIVSKSLVRYTEPFDIRHASYLVINNQARPNDQFVYRPSSRRVNRVSLRGESVFGTDFSFEDVFPRELEDADYERLPDVVHAGVDCWVVRAIPKKSAESEYSRFVSTIDKARSVPLRVAYWDDHEVQIKEWEVPVEHLEQVDAVWIAMRSTMRNLKLGSFTRHEVIDVKPNAPLGKSDFDLRRLSSSH